MKTSSAKNKGRILQKWIVEKLLALFPELTKDDIRSTSMGSTGEDVLLSTAAQKLIPLSFEAKSRASIAVYEWLDQAVSNAGDRIAVVIAKGNHEKPIAILDAEVFLKIIKDNNAIKDS